jgi:hypothetical protein
MTLQNEIVFYGVFVLGPIIQQFKSEIRNILLGGIMGCLIVGRGKLMTLFL